MKISLMDCKMISNMMDKIILIQIFLIISTAITKMINNFTILMIIKVSIICIIFLTHFIIKIIIIPI